MYGKYLWLLILVASLVTVSKAMTRQQLKNSFKLLKKSCMGKINVTEDQIGEIEKGKFCEDRNAKCYMACIYQMSQVVKNNRLDFDAVIKLINVMYPVEVKEPVKTTIRNCKHVFDIKELCESAYQFGKCTYEDDPKVFIFP